MSGTDEAAIISVLTQRSNEQRQQIKGRFKLMFGKVGVTLSMCFQCIMLYACFVGFNPRAEVRTQWELGGCYPCTSLAKS